MVNRLIIKTNINRIGMKRCEKVNHARIILIQTKNVYTLIKYYFLQGERGWPKIFPHLQLSFRKHKKKLIELNGVKCKSTIMAGDFHFASYLGKELSWKSFWFFALGHKGKPTTKQWQKHQRKISIGEN